MREKLRIHRYRKIILLSGVLFILALVQFWQKPTVLYTKPALPCTATFEDGDGPYYLSNSPHRSDLRPPNTHGVRLIVTGRVLRSDCQTPVANALIDIWQADEFGTYVNEWYRSRVTTNTHGEYRFITSVPKGYGVGTAYRPPHIHYKIWINGKLIITSEMFFPDVKGKEGFNEAYIMNLSEKKRIFGKPFWEGSHDIIIPLAPEK